MARRLSSSAAIATVREIDLSYSCSPDRRLSARIEGSTMKLLLIGATGTIGHAVAEALSPRHEVVAVSRHSEPLQVDISSPQAVRDLFTNVSAIDGVISTAGAARFMPLAQLDDEDFAFSLQNKLMGQVNVIREALLRIRDGGVVIVTSGILSRLPAPGGAAFSLVNAG
jgi:NAD(P)-dependent dehydrogenase (short-subunit alcohol dehydrogenase family)